RVSVLRVARSTYGGRRAAGASGLPGDRPAPAPGDRRAGRRPPDGRAVADRGGGAGGHLAVGGRPARRRRDRRAALDAAAVRGGGRAGAGAWRAAARPARGGGTMTDPRRPEWPGRAGGE